MRKSWKVLACGSAVLVSLGTSVAAQEGIDVKGHSQIVLRSVDVLNAESIASHWDIEISARSTFTRVGRSFGSARQVHRNVQTKESVMWGLCSGGTRTYA